MTTPEFFYQERLPLEKDDTEYYLLTKEFVSTSEFEGEEVLKIDPEGLAFLARTAMHDISFFYRAEHVKQIAAILEVPKPVKKTISLLPCATPQCRGCIKMSNTPLSVYRNGHGICQKRRKGLDWSRRLRSIIAWYF
jgi:hypothetical protein